MLLTPLLAASPTDTRCSTHLLQLPARQLGRDIVYTTPLPIRTVDVELLTHVGRLVVANDVATLDRQIADPRLVCSAGHRLRRRVERVFGVGLRAGNSAQDHENTFFSHRLPLLAGRQSSRLLLRWRKSMTN